MLLNLILQLFNHTAGTNNLIIQGVGMVGLIFAIISFQNNKRHLILLFLGTAQFFFIIHFALLGAWTAFAMNIVGVTRTFLFLLRGRKKWMDSNILMYVFVFLFWIAGAVSWDSLLSLLPILAMTIETIGLWMKNPSRIRSIVIIPRPLWITYNIIYGSYAGIITEIFILISLLTGIVRFDIIPKKRKTQELKNETSYNLKNDNKY